MKVTLSFTVDCDAILKLVTGGVCGVWWLVDMILIGTGHMKDQQGNSLRRP
jgi:hypothetical protein